MPPLCHLGDIQVVSAAAVIDETVVWFNLTLINAVLERHGAQLTLVEPY